MEAWAPWGMESWARQQMGEAWEAPGLMAPSPEPGAESLQLPASHPFRPCPTDLAHATPTPFGVQVN